jgi:hypothetical protein
LLDQFAGLVETVSKIGGVRPHDAAARIGELAKEIMQTIIRER